MAAAMGSRHADSGKLRPRAGAAGPGYKARRRNAIEMGIVCASERPRWERSGRVQPTIGNRRVGPAQVPARSRSADCIAAFRAGARPRARRKGVRRADGCGRPDRHADDARAPSRSRRPRRRARPSAGVMQNRCDRGRRQHVQLDHAGVDDAGTQREQPHQQHMDCEAAKALGMGEHGRGMVAA